MENLVMDSYKCQDAVIFDVPGVYLNTDIPNEKNSRLKLVGKFVNIMCDVNPYHIPNIRYKNGNKVIYLSILKALYGCI